MTPTAGPSNGRSDSTSPGSPESVKARRTRRAVETPSNKATSIPASRGIVSSRTLARAWSMRPPQAPSSVMRRADSVSASCRANSVSVWSLAAGWRTTRQWPISSARNTSGCTESISPTSTCGRRPCAASQFAPPSAANTRSAPSTSANRRSVGSRAPLDTMIACGDWSDGDACVMSRSFGKGARDYRTGVGIVKAPRPAQPERPDTEQPAKR